MVIITWWQGDHPVFYYLSEGWTEFPQLVKVPPYHWVTSSDCVDCMMNHFYYSLSSNCCWNLHLSDENMQHLEMDVAGHYLDSP